jgi:hypothetical protein
MKIKNVDEIIDLKKQILNELREFVNNDENISKYKEFQDIRKKWYDLGEIPNVENINHNFSALLKIYYNNRNRIHHSLNELNKTKKIQLYNKLDEFLTFDSDRIDNWNKKTDEIKSLENEWKNVHVKNMSREEQKDLNKNFWQKYKQFFKNKKNFFKQLDETRQVNYNLKTLLIEEVEQIKNNTDWVKTANKIKDIQKKWKDIGEVPKKVRDEQYQQFKEACDYFFTQYRAQKEDKNLYKKIMNLESQIKNWQSNLLMFKSSKGSNSIKEEYEKKIEQTKKELQKLKEKYSA